MTVITTDLESSQYLVVVEWVGVWQAAAAASPADEKDRRGDATVHQSLSHLMHPGGAAQQDHH